MIAIENVRLFKELEARNRELTEALEQQTATGEILRVIATLAHRPADRCSRRLLESALRLCGATIGSVVPVRRRDSLSVAAIQGPAALLEAVKCRIPDAG